MKMNNKTKPQTKISLLIPCEIGDTQKLMDALDHVRNKIRVSTTIRGYAGDGFAWTVSAAEPANAEVSNERR
jgi:hypothetical protein